MVYLDPLLLLDSSSSSSSPFAVLVIIHVLVAVGAKASPLVVGDFKGL